MELRDLATSSERGHAPAATASRAHRRPAILLATNRDTSEMVALIDAAGLSLAGTVSQARDRPDPATFVGRGKLEDVRQLGEHLRDPPISGARPLLVVAGELRPTALFNLEDETHLEAWDRIRLILEIFQRAARVKEARLQVELARLRYELPFVHEALHRRLTGEHPGFMGGGEVEIRTYETHLKRRTKMILKELERIKKERHTRRGGRRRSGLQLVAIAGYTNSGKSSLLNAVTGSDAVVRNHFFSTLQTTTRRVQPKEETHGPTNVLLTDTVGFIRDLPPWLIDAFGSTLEEVTFSDAVLLVVDASEPQPIVKEKVETAQRILERIHAPRRQMVLLNKADLVSSTQRTELLRHLCSTILPKTIPTLFTSTYTREGLDDFLKRLSADVLDARDATVDLDQSNPTHAGFEHWLREHTEILRTERTGLRLRLRVRCASHTWGLLLREARRAEAHVDAPASTRNEGGGPAVL